MRPDLSVKQFRRGWRSIPAVQRIVVWCLVPPIAIALWLFGTRHVVARVAHELLRRYGYGPRTAEWLTVFDSEHQDTNDPPVANTDPPACARARTEHTEGASEGCQRQTTGRSVE
jgi:hypothetical protein